MSDKPNWNELFLEALTEAGVMSKAYSVFHNYSLGNALLATSQLCKRNMPLSPIASFSKWKELGRSVKKGERAISLVMPVTGKGKEGDANEGESFVFYILKKNWFSLEQTDGAEFAAEVFIPSWDKSAALAALGISQTAFESLRGNAQGYAVPNEKKFAVNPLAAMPWKTTFHELAHCLLHSDSGELGDGSNLAKDIKEVEAEAVAYLCCATLGLDGLVESRGYIQLWMGDAERAKEFAGRAGRVFSAANKILKAGECAK